MKQLYDKNTSQEIRNVTSSFKQLNEEIKTLNKTVSSVASNMAGKFKEVGSATKEVNIAVDKTAKQFKSAFENVDFVNIVNNIRNTFSALTSLLAPSLGFQQNMANISASTGIAGKDLDELGRIARQTGVQTGEGATAAAAAFQTLASQININKVGLEGLKTLQQETATLSQASGLSMNDAANVLAGTINQFGLSADEASRVVNVLAAGSLTGAAGINDLAASFNETARNAAASGLSLEETTGALELLSQNNLKGAEAGTVFNKILDSLRASLGEDLGGAGLSQALQTLQPLLTDTATLTTLFGTENATTAAFLINNATALDGLTTSLTDTNVAQEQAAIRSDTVAERMERVKANIDNMKISLFEATGGFTGYMSAITDSAVVVAQLLPLLSALKGLITAGTVATTLSTIATRIKTTTEKAAAGITTLWSIAQRGLNTAIKANPIGALVAAGVAVVSIFSVLYDKFDGFRQVVDGVKEVAIELGSTLISAVVEPFKTLLSGLSSVGEAIVSLIDGNFSEAAEKAKEGFSKIATSTVQLNPASIIGTTFYKSDISGAWDRGSAKKEEIKPEVSPEIDIEKILEEVKKATENIQTVNLPILNPVLATTGKQGKQPVQDETARMNLTKLSEPSLAIQPSVGNIDAETTKLNTFTEALTANQEVAVQQGSVWDTFTEKMSNMGGSTQGFVEGLGNMSEGMIKSFSKGAESLAAFGQQVGGTIREMISGVIAMGVSFMVMNALQTAGMSGPFGFALAAGLAALAGGLASSLFNSLIPSFANGGIVYGNTLAQVGEYPGAANNPEVIAPLSKLRQLIQPAFGIGDTALEFRIRGNDLYAIYNKVNNTNRRTR